MRTALWGPRTSKLQPEGLAPTSEGRYELKKSVVICALARTVRNTSSIFIDLSIEVFSDFDSLAAPLPPFSPSGCKLIEVSYSRCGQGTSL